MAGVDTLEQFNRRIPGLTAVFGSNRMIRCVRGKSCLSNPHSTACFTRLRQDHAVDHVDHSIRARDVSFQDVCSIDFDVTVLNDDVNLLTLN